MDKSYRLFRVNPWSGGWPWQYLEVSFPHSGRDGGGGGGGDQALVVDIIDLLPN